jgi:hypothetical protein
MSRVSGVRRIGMTEVKSYSKHWPCLFPRHGPGRQHTRRIELADWQRVVVDRYPGDFARGCPRYLFTNSSADILRLCGQTLDQLGVAWRFSKPNTISVARRAAVARLDEFIGPKY